MHRLYASLLALTFSALHAGALAQDAPAGGLAPLAPPPEAATVEPVAAPVAPAPVPPEPVAPGPVPAPASPQAAAPPAVTAPAAAAPAPPPPQPVPMPPLTPVKTKPKPKRTPFPQQVGLRGWVGGMLLESASVYGAGGQLRYRPNRKIAFDFGAGYYGGELNIPEATHKKLREIPLSAEIAWFMKRDGTFQLYLLTGPVVSFSQRMVASNSQTGRHRAVYYSHTLGLGLELRLGKHLGLHAELRGFLRTRVGDDDAPPDYQQRRVDGTPLGEGTSSTAGSVLNLGGTMYF